MHNCGLLIRKAPLDCCLQHFIIRRVLKERRGQQVGPHPHFSNGQNMGAFHGHFSWLFNHHIRSDLFCKDWTWHQAFDVRNLDKSNISITLAISFFFFSFFFFWMANGNFLIWSFHIQMFVFQWIVLHNCSRLPTKNAETLTSSQFFHRGFSLAHSRNLGYLF